MHLPSFGRTEAASAPSAPLQLSAMVRHKRRKLSRRWTLQGK